MSDARLRSEGTYACIACIRDHNQTVEPPERGDDARNAAGTGTSTNPVRPRCAVDKSHAPPPAHALTPSRRVPPDRTRVLDARPRVMR